jgi:hypothetical protein
LAGAFVRISMFRPGPLSRSWRRAADAASLSWRSATLSRSLSRSATRGASGSSGPAAWGFNPQCAAIQTRNASRSRLRGAARHSRSIALIASRSLITRFSLVPYCPINSLFGAFFPAWLLCVIVGIAGAAAARVTFVSSGFARYVSQREPTLRRVRFRQPKRCSNSSVSASLECPGRG